MTWDIGAAPAGSMKAGETARADPTRPIIDIQVAILAGGLATRLGPLTVDQAKSMIEIQGKPFLEYQIDFLRQRGITNIVVCIGHLGPQIENYFGDGGRFGVHLRYSREARPLGTAGCLKNAEALLKDTFFTLYGDSYLFLDFADAMSFFRQHDKLALMTVHKNFDRYERSNTVIEGNLVKEFSNKNKTEHMVYIEYGANIFRKSVLEMVPKGEPYSLNMLFQELIKQRELLAYKVDHRFYEIGSLPGLRDFEHYVLSLGDQQ